MTSKVVTSGKEFLGKDKLDGSGSDSNHDRADGSAPIEELAEVHTPDLSKDTFQIADKTFKIKVSNIKTQKVMVKSLASLNDLMAKIDIRPIIEKIQDKMNKADKKTKDVMKGLEGKSEEEIAEAFRQMADSDSGDTFLIDMADIVKEIITAGGIDTIMLSIMEVLEGIVFAICKSQDVTITRPWIEDNLSYNQAKEIFFMQIEKDEMQGRVIDFLALTIRLIS